jgi:hypothetical protein
MDFLYKVGELSGFPDYYTIFRSNYTLLVPVSCRTSPIAYKPPQLNQVIKSTLSIIPDEVSILLLTKGLNWRRPVRPVLLKSRI